MTEHRTLIKSVLHNLVQLLNTKLVPGRSPVVNAMNKRNKLLHEKLVSIQTYTSFHTLQRQIQQAALLFSSATPANTASCAFFPAERLCTPHVGKLFLPPIPHAMQDAFPFFGAS